MLCRGGAAYVRVGNRGDVLNFFGPGLGKRFCLGIVLLFYPGPVPSSKKRSVSVGESETRSAGTETFDHFGVSVQGLVFAGAWATRPCFGGSTVVQSHRG